MSYNVDLNFLSYDLYHPKIVCRHGKHYYAIVIFISLLHRNQIGLYLFINIHRCVGKKYRTLYGRTSLVLKILVNKRAYLIALNVIHYKNNILSLFFFCRSIIPSNAFTRSSTETISLSVEGFVSPACLVVNEASRNFRICSKRGNGERSFLGIMVRSTSAQHVSFLHECILPNAHPLVVRPFQGVTA